jgi:organic radical activating enzyme
MEDFYTIQGEGFHTGKAAYFLRVGGCDVGCYWCDVKESWNPKLHPLTDTDTIFITCARSSKSKVSRFISKLPDRILSVVHSTGYAFHPKGKVPRKRRCTAKPTS